MSTLSALPSRRSYLIVSPLGERGQHVVKDPFSGAYYHLGAEESFLLLKLDGTCTRDRIRDEFKDEFDEPLEDDDLDDFLELARSSNFIDYADGEARSQSPAPAPDAAPRSYEQSILYWRKPVFDPDKLFDWLEPKLRWIWTLPFVLVSSLLMIVAVAVLWSQREAATTQFAQAMRWQTFFIAWLTLIACTTAHEFAHGLTCKHWGGRVREVGFFLIFFLPAFYCDVSDAWLMREKSKRLWVTLAGAWCDLSIWALSVFVWRLSMPDTLLNYLAWVVMSITGVRTFFNFNPLLKLDGYYLLSDATGIFNLRQRSWDRFMATLRWLL